MRIAVDIDDTLNILDRAGVAGAYIARNKLPFQLKEAHANAFVRVYDWEMDDVIKFIHDGGLSAFVEAHARKGAAQVLGGWMRDGEEVIILTARARSWFGNPESISRDWLEKRRIPYSSLAIEEVDKGRYCAEHHISILVDDNLDHCLKAQEHGVCAVLAIGKCNEDRAKEIYFGSSTWSGIDKAVRRILQTYSLEERFANACPAREVSFCDGWEYRSDLWRGRRGNCIRPVLPSMRSMKEKIEEYERDRNTSVCRYLLTECDAPLDCMLAESGYKIEQGGRGVVCSVFSDEWDAEGVSFLSDFRVWTRDYRTVTGDTGILRAYAYIKGECFFATVYENEVPVAVGMAVLEHGAIGIFDLCVAPAYRGRNFEKRIMQALLAQGRMRNAEYAYYQLEGNDRVAEALCKQFGFQNAYHYWYRVKEK